MPKPVPGLLEWECRTFGLAFPSASRSRLCEGDLPCLPPRPTTPRSLHATALQHGLDTAQRGITMAVLYIGIEGEPEVEFVRALERAAHDAARPELRISILLDAARATRPCRDSQGVARWGGTARGPLRSPPTPVRTGLALASQLPCGGPQSPPATAPASAFLSVHWTRTIFQNARPTVQHSGGADRFASGARGRASAQGRRLAVSDAAQPCIPAQVRRVPAGPWHMRACVLPGPCRYAPGSHFSDSPHTLASSPRGPAGCCRRACGRSWACSTSKPLCLTMTSS